MVGFWFKLKPVEKIVKDRCACDIDSAEDLVGVEAATFSELEKQIEDYFAGIESKAPNIRADVTVTETLALIKQTSGFNSQHLGGGKNMHFAGPLTPAKIMVGDGQMMPTRKFSLINHNFH